MNKFLTPIICGMLIATGMTCAGYFIGQTMYNAKVALNIAEAKGLAERRVTANLVNWDMDFTLSSNKKTDLALLYKRAEELQKKISNTLQSQGFEESEIDLGIIDYQYHAIRDDKNVMISQSYSLNADIELESDKVQLVKAARKELNKLIAQGISLNNHAPKYLFTELNKIKPDMLKEATKNARIAAGEFASHAGVKVGGIRNARQGNFYIRDAGSDYGDTHKIEKDVRVVTNISFYLDK
ncbi:hypothetical protein LNTAR_18605 [Lentisphaera araneosa HTCC2155]|uniref:SIMPL domain-containing protein n=1 Tax=Lentisphaera araneosa HTCC2155 TaxID=313628 RepID=A6DNM7_9BACT|nr:SIMPL domain-containing protein [Lentisphaera araneosa]EDM26686.1 hypothetical protein LNTAR_18605 [Lentisphaera araneosa HTCC2155]